ncbi:MAG: ATP synthase F0 subunit B [Desulfobacteraceae bacterium]|nr:ATP synthase F0 subunit B [Desulfobacteraceae bacterium]
MKLFGRCGQTKKKSMFLLSVFWVILGLCGPVTVIASGSNEHAGAIEDDYHGDVAGSGSADHGAGHGHEIHWQNTDWAKVLNFAILVVGLFILVRKPIGEALNDRIKRIKNELESLETRKAEVEKQLADYNKKLAKLDKESEQIVSEYIRQGEDAKARILKEAQSAADRLKIQAEKNIAHEFNQAKLHLQARIVEKALGKAESLIKTQISESDQNRLVDEYLEKVGA